MYPKISNYITRKEQIDIIKKYRDNISNMEENGILNFTSNEVISYIEIPKISVYLPIYNGTSDEVMKKGIGILNGTSPPIGGKSTHCVLTGHTGILKAELFTRLKELKIDDYFYINTLGKELVYKVYQIKVVVPNNVEDLKIIDGLDLVTLVTCTPYGINTHRLLVQGERIEDLERIDKKSINKENKLGKVVDNKYYLVDGLHGIIALVIIIFCCILFKYIVKYIKKIRKDCGRG